MPRTFNDLPFPILNRNQNDARTIRAINKAFNQITWGEYDSFIIEYNGERKLVKQMNAKEIYWILIGDNIVYPWKRKWNEILNMDVLNWEKIWGNVHDNYLPYRVQSSMWEIVNLNYISSFSLNVMYNSPNICCHCKKIEEGPAHTILYCEISR